MDLIDILFGVIEDPIKYSIIFFIYVVLTAVFLPIPVEIGLFNPFINPVIIILILALGKGIGASIAFEIGTRIRGGLKKRSYKSSIMKNIVNWCENMIRRYGYYGLFIIMSTPLMIDSATLYLFSILNPKEEKGGLTRKWFMLINIFAGMVRGTIILLVSYFFAVKLL